MNPLYTARDLAHQVEDFRATTNAILENFAATFADAVERIPVKLQLTTVRMRNLRPSNRLSATKSMVQI